MSDKFPSISHDLWIVGRKMSVDVAQDATTPSTLKVTWTIPPLPHNVYNGAIVLLSENPFISDNIPEDGKRYSSSTNFIVPADKIGEAIVISAAYGYFGDNILSALSVDVTNTDPTKVYYASIHAASNVLQYYPMGVQSYPLASPVFDRSSTSYAGNIAPASTPPDNPFNGQTYYDTISGKVLIWNQNQAAWADTNANTVPIGARPPIQPNQIFFNSSSQTLKFFIGGMWVNCTSANTQVKFGNAWIPLGVVSTQTAYPDTPQAGDVILLVERTPMGIHNPPESLKVFTLGQWLGFNPSLIRFETSPSVYSVAVGGDKLFGREDIAIPVVGDFFYKSTTRDLLVWQGDDWVKADTENEGADTTDKIGVGTDGSYDQRVRLANVLKGQMGWPAVCVELNEEQFNIAIDNAIETFRMRADNAYSHRYIMMTLTPGQQSYYLNDPRNNTNKIVNILRIGRANTLGTSQLNDPVYGQLFIPRTVISGGQVDVVSMHLMAQLSETFEKIFAGNLVYTWDEATRIMMIHRNIARAERVVIECVLERTEQELLLDRWCKQWLQGWALAEIKEMLGMIRSKYSAVSGPNGGLSLNGDMLLSEARQDFEELNRQLNDYEVGNGGIGFGNTSFLIG